MNNHDACLRDPAHGVRGRFVALLGATLLSACSLTTPSPAPTVSAPGQWREIASDGETVVDRQWWRGFGSDELSTIVDEALAANHDLRAALARIDQARASARAAGAGLYPQIDVGADLTQVETDSGTNRSDTQFAARASISYEVDLWRRNQARRDAAEARVQSSRYDHDALALVLAADTATAYFDTLSLRQRRQIADHNLTLSRKVLELVEIRQREGAASALEVAQQRAAVATAEASRSTLTQQQRVAENTLALLRGRAPADSSITLQALDTLSVPAIGPGQPSALAARRPDIRRLETEILAANGDIAVARAALFPTLTLGIDPTLTASPGSAALSLAASLLQPIFRGGALQGEIERTRARQRELLENYQQGVLTAFREVENALIAVRVARERVAALEIAVDAARQAYQLSNERYLAGAIDFLTLLDAQATQLQSEDSLAQAERDRFVAAVDLYKALGGGWQP
jgi:NodT family efflux transporter outer membrane factor (OMF) lipoprotein